MATTPSQLGDGQLLNAKADLFTATTATLVTFLRLVNTNTAQELVNIYLLPSGGTARRIIPVNLKVNAGGMVSVLDDKEVLVLDNGDKIQGDTTTASKVDYVIGGAEVS